MPTFTGFAVSDFLVRHFSELVDLAFTRKMEGRLDDIAGGDESWREYLGQFYSGPTGLAAQVEEKAKLPSNEGAHDRARGRRGRRSASAASARTSSVSSTGRWSRPTSPPTPRPPTSIRNGSSSCCGSAPKDPRRSARIPRTASRSTCSTGSTGPYVQLGQQIEGSKEKPKRASLPKGVTPPQVTLEMAVGLLALPRLLGNHPVSGRPVKAGLGRFGPYILHDLGKGEAEFRSLKAGDDVLTVQLDRAVALLAEPKLGRGGRAAATPIREIGAHPTDGKPVQLFEGKYGPYVKHGDLNASVPKGVDPMTFALDAAVELIAEKGKAPKSLKAKGRTGAKKAAPRKKAAKKSAKKSAKKTAKKAA